jgi:hypothetical protein
MGFTQRQAAGKFTCDEAATFIDRLREQEPEESPAPAAGPDPRPSAEEQAVRRVPVGLLAAELRRRGWTVVEPPARR